MATVDDIILRATLRQEVGRGLDEIAAQLRVLNRTMASTQRQSRQTARDLDRVGDQARQATRQIVRMTTAVLGLNAALRGTRGLGAAISGIQGEAKLLIGVFATLIPAAVPVFAVLTASALAAGSAISSIGVALGVLALGFSGIGTAVEALASGDMDKINEAFANLSDSGQEFARTLFGLKPALDTLRGTAQTALLPGVQAALLTMLQILPNVNALVAVFGGALGQVAQQLANAFTSTGFTDFLQFLTDNVSDLNAMTNSAITLAGAFGDLFVAFYPLNAAINGGLANAVDNFAAFASGATGTLGQFLTYIESALPVVSEFFNLFGSTLLSLLEQLGQPGIVVLEALNGILTVIFALAPTIGALAQAIGVGLLGVVNALIPVIEQVGPLLGDVLVAAATAVADALVVLAPTIGQIAEVLSQQLLYAVQALAPFLPLLGEAFLQLLRTFEPLLPLAVSLIPVLGNALLGVFEALTPAIGGLLAALGPVIADLVTGLAPILPIIADLLAGVLTALTPLIPVLGDALLQILAAIVPVLPQIVDGFLQVVNALVPLIPELINLSLVTLPLIPTILELGAALLPALANGLSGLVPIISFLASTFTQVLQPVLELISHGIEGIAIAIGYINDAVGKLNIGDNLSNLLSKVPSFNDAVGMAFGDTGAAHGSGSLSSTLGAHAGIMAGLSGGVAISNALIGGGGRGYGSGDHQAGRALDLVGPGVGAYGSAARAAGHYAAMHGTGGNRHLHVAYRQGMGDTGASMAPRGPVSVGTAAGGGAVVVNFYGPVYGLEDFDARVGQAVDEKDRVAAARRKS